MLCLHGEEISDLLLIEAPSGLNKIKYFLVRQSQQVLVNGLKPGAIAS